MKRIYLDYASLTPIDPRVLREMKAFSGPEYANPSSIYKEGVAAKKALAEGRKKVADFLTALPDEIVFTSGGTEANGLAIEGAGRAFHRLSGMNANSKPHLITTNIEHSSIRECIGMLEKHGVEVTRLPVDMFGLIDLDELKKAIKPSTYMVSIMTVNNEIGSVQPIREIAKIIRHAREHITKSQYPLFHTDAAQAIYEDLNVQRLGVDLLTIDGSKSYGPRGIGALYVKRGTPIEQIIYGGGQEKGLRSGTENVQAIMGFAKSLEILQKERGKDGNKEGARLQNLSDYFRNELLGLPHEIVMNSPFESSPHILNVRIPGIDNEFFVLQLDAKGVACSTKSSCLRDQDESYVLNAIGADSKTAVRFSFGRWTTKGELKKTVAIIEQILHKE